MNQHEDLDRSMDPLLREALAELRAEPLPDVDWTRLRSTINARAQLPLARKRSRRTFPLPRRVVHLAVAASVLFALWLGPSVVIDRMQPSSTQSVATWDVDDILARALGDLTEQEFRLLVSGRANSEDLLAFAISE
jgi:anti-sigma factor RsiW